jgi:thiosulfate dehydrogenase
MNKKLGTVCIGYMVGLLGLVVGCPTAVPPPPPPATPPGYEDADAGRGGALYDKWWDVLNVNAPTTDHPFWSTRPDQESNTRTGADTWRCKECHGWDYKGVDGAYGSGSHKTGIAGIFGTSRSAQEVFDLVKTTHGFEAAGLADEDILDLAKFVLEAAQIDTDDIIDTSGAFIGSADSGMSTFDTTCAACHGPDGLSIPLGGDPDFADFVGLISNDNPWEFQHKVRFGQPGTAMPRQLDVLTVAEVGDLGAYAQSLPEAPTP